MKPWKKLKHDLEYRFFRALLSTFSVLPKPFSSSSAALVLKTAGIAKLDKLAMANLDLAYGDSLTQAEKRKILRGLYRNLGRITGELSEILHREKLPEIRPSSKIKRALEEILKKGKGGIIVTPHFGNWECIPHWFGSQGYDGIMVGKKLKNQKLNDFLHRLRTAHGTKILYQNESPRKLLRLLENNELIGILPDADTQRLHGIFLEHFGRPTYTPTAPAALSIASGAPILPIFLVYREGEYELTASDPVYPAVRKKTAEEIQRLSQYWTDAFETMIRRYPDQWVWFQRRWVTKKTTEEESA